MDERDLREKHESDLTKKEKRLLEKQKLSGMSFIGKLEYIWMYYKSLIFGVIAAVILAAVVVNSYQNAKTKSILSIAVVNAGESDTEAFAAEIRDFFGSTDKYEKVDILTNIMTDAEGKNFVQYGEMAFLTQIHADAIDVVLMPEPLYESLKDEQLFADLREVLDEETYEAFGDKIDEMHITADKDVLSGHLSLMYEPVAVCVIGGAANMENAAEWLASLT